MNNQTNRNTLPSLRRFCALLGTAFILFVAPIRACAQGQLPIQWLYSPILSVSSTAYSPDGTMIAIGGNGGVQIFSASSFTLLRSLEVDSKDINAANEVIAVNSVAFSKDGKTLAVGGLSANYNSNRSSAAGIVQIWNPSTGSLVSSFPTAAGSINAVALSPDGTTLVDGGYTIDPANGVTTGVLELWTVSTKVQQQSLKTGATSSVNSIAFSPSGSILCIGGASSSTGVIELWNAGTSTLTFSLNTSANTVINSVAFSSDGTMLADGGESLNTSAGPSSGVLELWNVASGKLNVTLPTASNDGVGAVAFSKDGTTLADGGGNGNGVLELWGVSSGTLLTKLTTTNPYVGAICLSADGSELIDGGGFFSLNANLLTNGVLEEWDLASDTRSQTINLATANGSSGGNAIAFSPDGKTLANAGGTFATPGWLQLWNASTGALITSLKTAATQINSVVFSPDSTTLAVGGWTQSNSFIGVVELWSVATGKLIRSLNTESTYINCVAFSPNGKTLAINGTLNTGAGLLQLWDVASGTLSVSLPTLANQGAGGIGAVTFSPDGNTLASGSTTNSGTTYSGVLELWDVPTETLIKELPTGANNGVLSLAFSPDGKTLAAGGDEYTTNTGELGVLELWTVSTGKLLSTLSLPTGTTSITSLAISPDGEVLFAGAEGPIQQLQAFSLATNGLLAYYDLGLSSFKLPVAVSFSGSQIAVGPTSLEISANPFYNAIALSSLSIEPSAVIGGTSSIGTITLAQPAPSGGDDVILTSNNLSVGVPPSVSIPAGATQATFTVTTATLANDVSATITATSGGVTKSSQIDISNLSVSALAANPPTVVGGTSSTMTITLSGQAPTSGVAVGLLSNNSAVSVPPFVLIPNGMTTATFTVTTTPVSTTTSATVTAGNGSAAKSAVLTVSPPQLSSVTVDPTTVVGGNSVEGTVTLSGPAGPNGMTVALSSSNSSAKVPTSIFIYQGNSSATFVVTTDPVSSQIASKIQASLNGQSQTATLTISPVTLALLSVSPSTVSGGSSTTGTVSLNANAGTKGFVVSLSSNNSAAVVPATVTVPSGQSDVTFIVKTAGVSAYKLVTITAKNGKAVETAALSINPPSLTSVTLSPSVVVGGVTSTGTVTLTGPAGAGGIVVKLSSSLTSATVSSSVTVPSGKTSTTFTVKTSAVAAQKTATITAKFGAASPTATLTLNPPTVKSVTLNPTSVVGGKSSTATVTVTSPAPSTGLVITLSASASIATVPATVTIASGKTSTTFTVKTVKVTSSTTSTITAGNGGVSASAVLKIT